jgi:hypothetical protein
MRLFTFLSALFFGFSAEATTLLASKSALVSRIRSPLSFKEEKNENPQWPGKSSIVFDFKTSDLDLKLYNVDGKFSIEAVLDVSKVHQSILPTDDYGRLTKEAKALAKNPFIRFESSHFPSELVNVKCTRVQCRGIWTRFPYKSDVSMLIKAETNIRGLAGRTWTINLNQILPERGAVNLKADFFPKLTLENPYRGSATPPSRILQTRLYKGGEVLTYDLDKKSEADIGMIHEWRFDPEANGGIGYHKLSKQTAFEVWEGPALFEISPGSSLEAFELYPGDRINLPVDTILAISPG